MWQDLVFIDLRAAFDSVEEHKEVLLRLIKRRGVRERLVKKMEEILRETKGEGERRIGGEFLDDERGETVVR